MRKPFAILLAGVVLFISVTGCIVKDEGGASDPFYTSSIDALQTSSADTSDISSADVIDVSSRPSSEVSSEASNPSSLTSSDIESSGLEPVVKGKLIVRGKDLSEDYYFWYTGETGRMELPFTAILRELGAKVEWRDRIVKVTYGTDISRLYDTTESEFGIPTPPGARDCIRKIVDGEMITDFNSIREILVRGMHAKVDFDEENKILIIN